MNTNYFYQCSPTKLETGCKSNVYMTKRRKSIERLIYVQFVSCAEEVTTVIYKIKEFLTQRT